MDLKRVQLTQAVRLQGNCRGDSLAHLDRYSGSARHSQYPSFRIAPMARA